MFTEIRTKDGGVSADREFRLLYKSIGVRAMLNKIDADNAKTRLSEILRRVEAGESFTITNNRGKPVADIVPSRTGSRLKAQAAISNILAAMKHPVSDDTLAELKDAGRK